MFYPSVNSTYGTQEGLTELLLLWDARALPGVEGEAEGAGGVALVATHRVATPLFGLAARGQSLRALVHVCNEKTDSDEKSARIGGIFSIPELLNI